MGHAERRERRERAVQMVREGASLAQAAEDTGLAPLWVRSCAVAAGVPVPMGHAERRKRRDAALEMLRDGASFEDVAQEFGLSLQYVENVARLAGVRTVRPVGGNTLLVIAALLRGEAVADVATRLGVSKQRVYQIRDAAREAGIPGL